MILVWVLYLWAIYCSTVFWWLLCMSYFRWGFSSCGGRCCGSRGCVSTSSCLLSLLLVQNSYRTSRLIFIQYCLRSGRRLYQSKDQTQIRPNRTLLHVVHAVDCMLVFMLDAVYIVYTLVVAIIDIRVDPRTPPKNYIHFPGQRFGRQQGLCLP